jgi:hypothetical protein
MPFVAAPNVVQVEIRALLDSQRVENVFDIDTLAPVDATVVDDVCNIVSVWAQEVYFPLLPGTVSLTEVFAKDLTSIDGAQHSIAPSGTVVGGNGAASYPNETTFCVSLRSAASGRSARGRKYVLAITTGLITGNHLNATLRGQFVAAFEELRSRIATAGWLWIVMSRVSGGVARPGGPVYYPITTVVSTDDIVDSQRRRKPGNGS